MTTIMPLPGNRAVTLYRGDCVEKMGLLAAESFDACVTDPPYHFASIVKRFGADGAAPAKSNGATGVYKRASSGFMGKQWDGGNLSFRPETWEAVGRVLKPGAHLVAFAAPKNAHRLTCAIEDAGFEIRDVVMWLFGQGFPKSHNVGNKLEQWLDYGEEGEAKKAAVVDEWEGWGTALKPAYEPIIIARKPLAKSFTVAANVLEYGTGAINIDACRLDDPGKHPGNVAFGVRMDVNTYGARYRVPFDDSQGRWPANIVHDGSEEVLEMFPDSTSGAPADLSQFRTRRSGFGMSGGSGGKGDSGSAARFFYCAKASADERAGSKHPTVKPLALLQWLVRMVARKGAHIIDPFAGTGTTAEAAHREGVDTTLIEADQESQEDICRRVRLIYAGPEERANAIRVARGQVDPFEQTELGRVAA